MPAAKGPAAKGSCPRPAVILGSLLCMALFTFLPLPPASVDVVEDAPIQESRQRERYEGAAEDSQADESPRKDGLERETGPDVGEDSQAESPGKDGQWRSTEVPNPWTQPSRCGLPRPGWLCDPDGLLSPAGRGQVMDVLLAIREKTRVQCPSGERGYQVAVALVQWMHPDTWLGSKETTAKTFAQEIGDTWGVGDPGCGNGVVLFISVGDRYAYIKTNGPQKLTDTLATTVVDNMKPLLREKDYDNAVLQAAIQIYDVFQGKRIPGEMSPWLLLPFLLVGLCFFWPLVVVPCCGFLTLLLLPFAHLLDRLSSWCRGRRRRSEERAAQQDLQRVQQELQRPEFEQTMCPICLEEFSSSSAGATSTLDCRHQFHQACIDQWVQEHGTCPLCRADVEAPLAPEDEAQPQEYQRRLRFYMSRVRRRHSFLLDGYSSTPYYRRQPDTGHWVFYHHDGYYGRYGGRSSSLYSTALQQRFGEVTRGASSWFSTIGSSSGNGGSSRRSSGGGGFGGGGGFSSGGGGGGGW